MIPTGKDFGSSSFNNTNINTNTDAATQVTGDVKSRRRGGVFSQGEISAALNEKVEHPHKQTISNDHSTPNAVGESFENSASTFQTTENKGYRASLEPKDDPIEEHLHITVNNNNNNNNSPVEERFSPKVEQKLSALSNSAVYRARAGSRKQSVSTKEKQAVQTKEEKIDSFINGKVSAGKVLNLFSGDSEDLFRAINDKFSSCTGEQKQKLIDLAREWVNYPENTSEVSKPAIENQLHELLMSATMDGCNMQNLSDDIEAAKSSKAETPKAQGEAAIKKSEENTPQVQSETDVKKSGAYTPVRTSTPIDLGSSGKEISRSTKEISQEISEKQKALADAKTRLPGIQQEVSMLKEKMKNDKAFIPSEKDMALMKEEGELKNIAQNYPNTLTKLGDEFKKAMETEKKEKSSVLRKLTISSKKVQSPVTESQPLTQGQRIQQVQNQFNDYKESMKTITSIANKQKTILYIDEETKQPKQRTELADIPDAREIVDSMLDKLSQFDPLLKAGGYDGKIISAMKKNRTLANTIDNNPDLAGKLATIEKQIKNQSDKSVKSSISPALEGFNKSILKKENNIVKIDKLQKVINDNNVVTNELIKMYADDHQMNQGYMVLTMIHEYKEIMKKNPNGNERSRFLADAIIKEIVADNLNLQSNQNRDFFNDKTKTQVQVTLTEKTFDKVEQQLLQDVSAALGDRISGSRKDLSYPLWVGSNNT